MSAPDAPAENAFYPGAWAQRTPDRAAVVMAESGDSMTYRELDDVANRLARLFREAGLAPGDHVAFCLENRVEYLAIMWGAHYAGLYYTAISSRLTTDELGYIIQDSGSRAFITSPYKANAVAELGSALDGVDTKLCVGGELPGFESFEAAIARHSAEPLADRFEGQPMLYSSGTTGRPKGVKSPMTGDPLGKGEGLALMILGLFGGKAESVYLSPAPLYHSAPLRYCTQFHRIGATIVVMERFDAEGALAAIERFRVTHSQWVPTMFVRMLKLDEAVRARYDLSSLDLRDPRGGALPRFAVKEQMLEWWGPVIHEYYAGHRGQRLLLCQRQRTGSPTRAPSARRSWASFHIVDDEGNEVPGRRRRAASTSRTAPQPSFEYHEDPEKTAAGRLPRERLDARSATLGASTEDGFLYLTDRKANMIISGGVNIYPQETENVLTDASRRSRTSRCSASRTTDFGEEVKAVVQPVKPDEDAGEALEKRADRVLPRPPGGREMSALDRLSRRAAAAPDRKALQATPEGRVLEGARHAGALEPPLPDSVRPILGRPHRVQQHFVLLRALRTRLEVVPNAVEGIGNLRPDERVLGELGHACETRVAIELVGPRAGDLIDQGPDLLRFERHRRSS